MCLRVLTTLLNEITFFQQFGHVSLRFPGKFYVKWIPIIANESSSLYPHKEYAIVNISLNIARADLLSI